MSSSRYQDVYPSEPLLDSAASTRRAATDLLTLEFFEAPPASMPTRVFDQHHILLNLREEPHRVENWRGGEHRDFIFLKDEIIVTPAGIESGWRWHATSNVIVITLDPAKLEKFAQNEVGVLLTGGQLKDLPQFIDPDICQAGVMLRDALASDKPGSAVMFECLARVFLVKLIQEYGVERDEEYAFSRRFTARHYQRVFDYVATNFAATITVEQLAGEAGISASHFARLFKKTIGESPMQFVMSYRIEQAKKLLVQQDTPIIDIAMSCGFSDQAHFSRAFKRAEDLTPGRYREQQTG
ncbi:MAG: helix-turn-helix transcriptional regulator [Pseudomonadota bacterium]